ncbi:MAG TPA: hypothetical protein PK559_11055 [Ignavibacteriaceae bacterium]|nr:hypothetical protein [Ignavibacteriaceae bacterium]
MARKIGIYGNYFEDFYIGQSQKVKDKIDYVPDIIRHVNQVPIRFLKHIEGTDGLFEINLKRPLKTSGFFVF